MGFIIGTIILLILAAGVTVLLKFVLLPMILKRSDHTEDIESGKKIPKKYPEAKLGSYAYLFAALGFFLSMLFTYITFSYTEEDYLKIRSMVKEDVNDQANMIIPNTQQPPPKPKKKIKIPEIKEVKKEEIEEKEEEIEIPDLDDEISTDDVEIMEEPEPEKIDNTIYESVNVGQPAVYPGGEGEMMNDVMSNFNYPEIDKQQGNQGIIYVRFLVDKSGKVEQVEVVRGINERLDKEAIRTVQSLKRFKPAKNAGLPVKVRYMMPIRLKIQ